MKLSLSPPAERTVFRGRRKSFRSRCSEGLDPGLMIREMYKTGFDPIEEPDIALRLVLLLKFQPIGVHYND